MGLYGKLTPVKCTGQQNQLFCSIRFKPFNLIKGLQDLNSSESGKIIPRQLRGSHGLEEATLVFL